MNNGRSGEFLKNDVCSTAMNEECKARERRERKESHVRACPNWQMSATMALPQWHCHLPLACHPAT